MLHNTMQLKEAKRQKNFAITLSKKIFITEEYSCQEVHILRITLDSRRGKEKVLPP